MSEKPVFLIWDVEHEDTEKIAFLTGPLGGPPAPRLLDEGVSLAGAWSPQICFRLDAAHPEWNRLGDNMHSSPPVVSARLKSALEDRQLAAAEFLPVRIEGADGSHLASDYHVLNPLRVIDAIDLDASGVEWNPLDESLIDDLDRLVIRPEAVPGELDLFRCQHLPNLIIARRRLVDHLATLGLSGLCFMDPADYMGVGYAGGTPYFSSRGGSP